MFPLSLFVVQKRIKTSKNQEVDKNIIKNNTKVELQKFKLDDFESFKFFSKDYNDRFYFWECLIFFRKFLLSIIMNVRSLLNNEIQIQSVILILSIYLIFASKFHLYKSKKANNLEIFSLIICILASFSTFVFSSKIYDKFKIIIYFLFVIINLSFFLMALAWITPFYARLLIFKYGKMKTMLDKILKFKKNKNKSFRKADEHMQKVKINKWKLIKERLNF